MKKHYLLFLHFIFGSTILFAQNHDKDRETTLGIGVRSMFPSAYFRTGPKNFNDSSINYSISQSTGFSVGAYIKHSFNKKVALESGISYTKRFYKLTLTDTTFTGGGSFKVIGYEIPINLSSGIQLGKQSFMSASLGLTIDFFPSDVVTFKEYFIQYSYRVHRADLGVTAGLGYSWKTMKSGTVYFGLSYHRSFTPVFNEQVEYYPNHDFDTKPTSTGRTVLQGDYLSIDLRYYFPDNKNKPEDKEKFYY